jgi:hypothetical protein
MPEPVAPAQVIRVWPPATPAPAPPTPVVQASEQEVEPERLPRHKIPEGAGVNEMLLTPPPVIGGVDGR